MNSFTTLVSLTFLFLTSSLLSQETFTILPKDLGDYPNVDLTYVNNVMANNTNSNSESGYVIIKIADIFTYMVDGVIPFTMTSEYLPSTRLHSRKVEYVTDTKYKWRGTSIDKKISLTLTKDEYGTCGSFYLSETNTRYHIIAITNDESVLVEVSENTPHCDLGNNSNNSTIAECDENCPGTIDVLFVLDDESLAWLGNNARPHLDRLIADLEEVWQNSESSNRISYSIDALSQPFDLNPSCEGSVEDLAADSEIQQLRNNHNADVVVYLPVYYDFAFSIACAAAIGPDDQNAYVIIPMHVSLDDNIFPHEIGHVMGAWHNWQPNQGTDCARGYFAELDNGDEYPTVMASSSVLSRIPHYSDPDILWRDVETGKWDGDNSAVNAGKIRGTGCQVAGFRIGSSIYSNIFVDIVNCQLFLDATISETNPNYTYEWHWSLDGLFNLSSPGEYLGGGIPLTVDEPVSNNCRLYFIQLKVLLNGVVVSTTVYNQQGGVCTYNVLPCDPPDSYVERTQYIYDYEKLDVFVEHSALINRLELYNLNGQKLGKASNMEEIRKLISHSGVYLLFEHREKELFSIKKKYFDAN